jgi:hypothetical protein
MTCLHGLLTILTGVIAVRVFELADGGLDPQIFFEKTLQNTQIKILRQVPQNPEWRPSQDSNFQIFVWFSEWQDRWQAGNFHFDFCIYTCWSLGRSS